MRKKGKIAQSCHNLVSVRTEWKLIENNSNELDVVSQSSRC